MKSKIIQAMGVFLLLMVSVANASKEQNSQTPCPLQSGNGNVISFDSNPKKHVINMGTGIGQSGKAVGKK